jgi:hypothetical protein
VLDPSEAWKLQSASAVAVDAHSVQDNGQIRSYFEHPDVQRGIMLADTSSQAGLSVTAHLLMRLAGTLAHNQNILSYEPAPNEKSSRTDSVEDLHHFPSERAQSVKTDTDPRDGLPASLSPGRWSTFSTSRPWGQIGS